MNIRKSLAGVLIVAGAALLWSGCAGPDNAAACQAYIDKVNTLSCFKGAAFTFDCSAFDNTTCDISDYFNCLTDNTKCDAMGIPDQSGTVSCTSKASCN